MEPTSKHSRCVDGRGEAIHCSCSPVTKAPDVNKIDLLNSIEVIDDSACCGKLEYVHVANTPMNRKKLRQVGATDQEINEATDAFDESIDIACISSPIQM